MTSAALMATEVGRRRVRRPRVRRNIVVLVSAVWMGLLIALAVLQPFLPIPDPTTSDYAAIATPPSADHWLGTDEIGRDIFARTVVGARVSLTVGFGSVAIALLVGTTLGVVAGFHRGGWIDRVVSLVTDVLLAFPALVLLIALTVFLGPGLVNTTIGIAIVATPYSARVARAQTITYASREFVTAAKAAGARNSRVIVKEILPNIAVPVISYALVNVAVAIVAEGGLSFLGLGVPPPSSSWGSMMGNGSAKLGTEPHIALIPAAAMAVTLLALNFLADHFNKHFDVKEAAL